MARVSCCGRRWGTSAGCRDRRSGRGTVLARTLHAIVFVAAGRRVCPWSWSRALTSDDVGTRLVRLVQLLHHPVQHPRGDRVGDARCGDRTAADGCSRVLRLDALLCIAVTGIVYHAVLAGLQD